METSNDIKLDLANEKNTKKLFQMGIMKYSIASNYEWKRMQLGIL